MCRSKAEGGRRCTGGTGTATPAPAAHQAGDITSHMLASEMTAVTRLLEDAGDAQYALEEAADRLSTVLAATAGAGTELRAGMLSLHERIESGLSSENLSRAQLLDDARTQAGDITASAGLPGASMTDAGVQDPAAESPGAPVMAQTGNADLDAVLAKIRDWQGRPVPAAPPAEPMTPQKARLLGCDTPEGRARYDRLRAYRAAGYDGPLDENYRLPDITDPRVVARLDMLAALHATSA